MKKKFRSLEITAKTLISSFGTATHVSPLKDSLVDVDVVRDYQPGDKRLDSKSSLRTSRTMSRVFTPEKSMNLFMALDVSASQFSKLDATITACLYLTYLADLANDKVGLLTFSDCIHELVMPTNDGRAVVSVLEKRYESEPSGTTNLEKALHCLGGLELENSTIFIISDFCYNLTDRALVLCKRIAARINTKLVALVAINSDEWIIPNLDFSLQLMDAEGDSSIEWNMSGEKTTGVFHDWQHMLRIRLRQAKAQPVFMYVERKEFLMSLIKFFLR